MGNKGDNKYAMVLLAVADHKYRIEVGYGLEGILPDGKTGDIGRDMVPDLKASDYDGAVTLAVGEIAKVIADDAKITLNQAQPVAPPSQPADQGSSLGKLILLDKFFNREGGGCFGERKWSGIFDAASGAAVFCGAEGGDEYGGD